MRLIEGVKGFVDRVLASCVAYPSGIVALRAGRLDVARARLAWVLRRHPRHFSANVRLGCLLLRQGNQIDALRLLNQARWIDPFRFESLALPARVHSALGHDPLLRMRDAADHRATAAHWPSVSGARQGGAHPTPREISGAGGEGSHRGTKPFRYRDFTSMPEYLRFRRLPPITRAEVRSVDWDLLLARLGRTLR